MISRISAYEQILFTSPESVGEFLRILIAERIDIRKVKADFYGCSTKSVKSLNEKGFFANLEREMPLAGKLLVVGDSDISSEYPHAEKFITSKKMIDEQFTQIFKRVIEEASVNTIILPSSRSVKYIVEEGIIKEIIPQQLLKTSKVVCMGVRTGEAAEEYGITPNKVLVAPDKTSVIDCLARKEAELSFL